jgi:hypothetical protein
MLFVSTNPGTRVPEALTCDCPRGTTADMLLPIGNVPKKSDYLNSFEPEIEIVLQTRNFVLGVS